MKNLHEVKLFAWVGEDELGSGQVGLKQARVPAGTIAIVAIERGKVDTEAIIAQLQAQADRWGKPISLCRFELVEVLRVIEPRRNGTY
jgi:hypothetical protein